MPLDQPGQLERALNPNEDASVDESRMAFGDHLEELRHRVILALCGAVVTTVIALFFGRQIVAWLIRPLAQVLSAAGLPEQTHNFTPAGGFAIYLKVSVVAGLILAAPWIVYQIWRFVEGGLYRHERRVVLILLPFSSAMVALAVAFLYYVMLPLSLAFLVGFSLSYPPAPTDAPPANPIMQRLMETVTRASGGWRAEDPADTPAPEADAADPGEAGSPFARLPLLPEDPASPTEGEAWIKLPERELRVYVHGQVQRYAPAVRQSMVQPLLEVRWYIGFVVLMGLGLVIAFQLPVVMLTLGWTGVVDPAVLSRARKYCVFGCVALGAVLTPSDPVTMVVLALPLWALFELGLMLMRWSAPADATQQGDA